MQSVFQVIQQTKQNVLQFGGNHSERYVLFDEVVQPGIWPGQPASFQSDQFCVLTTFNTLVF